MSDRIDTDGVLHSAMLANHFETKDEKIDYEGELWQPLKEKQRDEVDLFNVLRDVGTEVRNEALLHAFFEHAAHAVGFGGLFVTAGVETVAKTVETIQQGDELNVALKRQCAVGASILLAGSALPEGFKTDVENQFAEKGKFSSGSEAVCWTLLRRPDGAQIRAGMVANCRDGQRYALDRHITSAADLEVALGQNPEFASRYEHDLAFKLGTDSVIWANAQGQLPVLERQVPPAPMATVAEVRG